MPTSYTITAYYKFFSIPEDEVQAVRDQIDRKGQELDMIGLTLVATEGINGTVAGSVEAIEEFKECIQSIAAAESRNSPRQQSKVIFKDSISAEKPYKRWYVKIRDSIVNLGTEANPHDVQDTHLTPDEWNEIVENEDVVILDTRNNYETEIGVFKDAVDPKLKTFQEFPEYVSNCDIPKDKKVLMYCTGGIRCEKALVEMKKQGYQQVYQLKGGILQYLKEYPHKHFEGECFVFDHRAAVDQDLEASSRYSLCPLCGDPGDQHIACSLCGTDAVICIRCKKHEETCSKDCRNKMKAKVSA